jgi:hypothetical protein
VKELDDVQNGKYGIVGCAFTWAANASRSR